MNCTQNLTPGRGSSSVSAAFAVLAAATGALVTLPGCTTNPTTGRSQFNTLSRADEIKIGTDATPGLTTEYGGKVANPELVNYVSSLGKQLAATTEADNPTLPWEFTLLDSDVINAFALPGGKVFVSRGLAEKMDNEAQLAAVVGHEIGHVCARHTSERMTQQVGAGVAAAVAGVIVGGVTNNDTIKAAAPVAFSAGSQLIVLSFSRDQELEADGLGMRYMTRLNYDPIGAQQVMELLKREAGGGGGAFDKFLSTHPDPAARVEVVKKKLAKEYAYTQGNPQYQLHADRFRQQFLAKLPARVPVKKAEAGHGRVFDLSQPAGWCAVCAARPEVEGVVLAERVRTESADLLPSAACQP